MYVARPKYFSVGWKNEIGEIFLQLKTIQEA
jgi:hypothetical protein